VGWDRWAEQCDSCTVGASRKLDEAVNPDSWVSLAGAAKVEVEEDKARVARKTDELVDSFISKNASCLGAAQGCKRQGYWKRNLNPRGKITFKGKDGISSRRERHGFYSNN